MTEIKTWGDRLAEIPDGTITTSYHVTGAMQDEIDELRATVDRKPNKDMTDKEAEDMMYAMLDAKSKEIDIQKKYIQKLKSAIPPRKIAQLFRLEKDFKEKVISNMKERRMGRKGGM